LRIRGQRSSGKSVSRLGWRILRMIDLLRSTSD